MHELTAENNLTIIPARSGSKRVPGKNIKYLAGKPLLAWTIEAAKNTQQLENIYVSTDSQEIADVALNYGADVYGLRSAELSADDSPTIDALNESIYQYEQETGKNIKWITLLQATSPFRNAATIDKAVKVFKNSGGKSVVSISKHTMPFDWLSVIDTDGYLRPANINNKQTPLYHYNGAIYICTRETIDVSGDIYGRDIVPFIMEGHIESLDIDTFEDWELASLLASAVR